MSSAEEIASGGRGTLEIVPSVCPHDCTSTCALDVERLDARTIGRVRGSTRNTYTAGVICEKVGRYAERIHHPDRLLHPLRRVGPKGSGQFARISWEEALDRVAEAFAEKAARHGSETVWPYFYAGTMGLVQRDGINRLRHVMRYSRWFSTICVTLSDTGWIAGTGAKRGVDLREVGEHSDLVVIWGGNPVNTQVNVMTHVTRAQAARRDARRGRPVPDGHGGARRRAPGPPARHRRRARVRGHARPLRRGLRGLALSAALHRRPGRAGRASPDPDARVGRRDHGADRRADRGVRPPLRPDQAELHPLPPRVQPVAKRRRADARGLVPPRGDGRVAAPGRRARSTARRPSTRSTAASSRASIAWTGRSARSTSRGSDRS